MSDRRAPELSATVYLLIWRICCNLYSLSTNPLKRLLIGFCDLELDGGNVTLTLRVLLLEMLGGPVLEVLEPDVILVTTSAVNAGVATEARFSPISVLTRVHCAGPGVVGPAAQMVHAVFKVTIWIDATP